MSDGVEVSVVLPAYNEEATIRDTITTTLETLGSFLPAGSYEVLVAEDGCDDRTPQIASQMAQTDGRIRHVHSDARLGRGGALERTFREANGQTLVYFDTDLATDMQHLEELVESVRSGEYDFATGSRMIPGKKADRPPKRGVPSIGYNALVRLILRSNLKDHQCGFKAFDRDALLAVLDDVEDEHWFWDTEVLVRAQRNGYEIKEFPVDWTPKGDTKVDLVRDVFGMGSQIVRTFWQLSVSPRVNRRTSLAGGTLLVVIAIALMTVYLDPQQILDNVQGANRTMIGGAAVIYALSWPLRGLRYRDILSELGYRENVSFLTGAIFISQTGNLVFPARAGDAVRAYVVKARRSIPYPSGFASLAVERVFDLLTITVLAGTVLLGLVAFDPSSLVGITEAITGDRQSGRIAIYVAATVGAAAIGATGLIVASARSDRNYVRTIIQQLSSDSYADYVASVVERFTGDIQTVAGNRDSFLRIGLSSLLIWSLDVVTAIIVFAAFDVSVPVTLLVAVGFFAVSVGNLAKVLPLSPGGIGLYEGAFSVLVVGLLPSVSWELALGAAIVDHAVKNVVTIVGGLVSMGYLNVSLTTAVEESRDAGEA